MKTWKKPEIQGLEDIVHDASLIRSQTPPIDLSWILNKLFPPRRRSLVPVTATKERETKGKLSIIQNAYLVVTLMGANNLQSRQDQSSNSEKLLMSPPSIRRLTTDLPFLSSPKLARPREDTETTSNQKKKRTSCLARVRFQNQTYFSRVVTGDCPLWEQIIEVPLPNEAGQELTPLKLKEIKDSIEITLFDKVELDVGKGGGYYDDEETVVQENRFLGFVKVPFPTLNYHDKVVGHFILNTPEVLLGYEQNNQDKIEDLRIDLESQRNKNEMLMKSNYVTSLTCSVSLEPKIGCDSSYLDIHDFTSNESQSTISHVKQWIIDYKSHGEYCHERNFNILVLGLNGKTWLVNRYLVSQSPPLSCDSSMHRCAHFVSLIPKLDNWVSFQGFKDLHDVWLPSQTCLSILAGNWSDHAVLLANYFMFLSDELSESSCKTDVYLVIGSSTDGKGAVSSDLFIFVPS